MTHGLNLRKLYTDDDNHFGAFQFFECLQSMPYLRYVAYQGASFCRVYAYSCNNLWPEELHSEVLEGTFCFINAYENHDGHEGDDQYGSFDPTLPAKLHQYLDTVVAPFYLFLME